MNKKEKNRVVRMIRAFLRQYGVHAALAEHTKENTLALAEKLGYSKEQLAEAFSLDRERDKKAIAVRRSFRESLNTMVKKNRKNITSSRLFREEMREIAPTRLKMCILFNLVEEYQAITKRLPECRIKELDDLLSVHSNKFDAMRKIRNGIMHMSHGDPYIRENRLFDKAGDMPRFFQELEIHIRNFFEKCVDTLFALCNELEQSGS